MTLATRPLLAAIALLLAAGPASRAQVVTRFGVYDPRALAAFGWGGWAQTTPMGDVARGMGAYAAGVGQRNVENSIAASINTDTMARWNTYMYNAQQINAQAYYDSLAAKSARVKDSRESIARRVLENPTQSDINSGDALNAMLMRFSDPRVQAFVFNNSTLRVPSDVVRDIPFQYAAGDIVFTLRQLGQETAWPEALQGPDYADVRARYQKAVDAARAETADGGQPSPETIQEIRSAVAALREKAEGRLRPNSSTDRRAEQFLKALVAVTRLLEAPKLEKVLDAAREQDDVFAGNLMRFMVVYNLRFGPARTARQKEVYQTLYRLFDQERETLKAKLAEAPPQALPPAAATRPPTDIFEGVSWDQLDGPPAPAQP